MFTDKVISLIFGNKNYNREFLTYPESFCVESKGLKEHSALNLLMIERYRDRLTPERNYFLGKIMLGTSKYKNLVIHRALKWFKSYFPKYDIQVLEDVLPHFPILTYLIAIHYDTKLEDYIQNIMKYILECENCKKLYKHYYLIHEFNKTFRIAGYWLREHEIINDELWINKGHYDYEYIGTSKDNRVYVRKTLNIEKSMNYNFIDSQEVKSLPIDIQRLPNTSCIEEYKLYNGRHEYYCSHNDNPEQFKDLVKSKIDYEYNYEDRPEKEITIANEFSRLLIQKILDSGSATIEDLIKMSKYNKNEKYDLTSEYIKVDGDKIMVDDELMRQFGGKIIE